MAVQTMSGQDASGDVTLGTDSFAPLSSFKEKHRRMKDGLDFIQVRGYAVTDLNNMFPVPAGSCGKVDFKSEPLPVRL